jgi:hypothetical protein
LCLAYVSPSIKGAKNGEKGDHVPQPHLGDSAENGERLRGHRAEKSAGSAGLRARCSSRETDGGTERASDGGTDRDGDLDRDLPSLEADAIAAGAENEDEYPASAAGSTAGLGAGRLVQLSWLQ